MALENSWILKSFVKILMLCIKDSLGAQCWVNLLFANQYKEMHKATKESIESRLNMVYKYYYIFFVDVNIKYSLLP